MEAPARFPALKHLPITGVLFAIALGWLATLLVNNAIGVAMEATLGIVLTRYYLGALLLTATLIGLITLCIVTGNQVFVRLTASRLNRHSLVHSTVSFSVFVLAVVGPQVAEIGDRLAYNLSWAYRQPEELVLMISLPVIRLLILPTLYYIAGARQVVRVDA